MADSRNPPPLPAADTSDFIARLHRGTATHAEQEKVNLFAEAASPSPAVRTLACMVTHGMGQQVRFETCALIAEAFVRGGRKPAHVHANRVQLTPSADLLARMEVIFLAQDGEPETHVHIYEGYWAPLTEGKISLTATILFLFSAGWRGLKACVTKPRPAEFVSGRRGLFTRWVFQHMHEFPIKKKTFAHLLWIVAILAIGVGLAYWCEQTLLRVAVSLKAVLATQHVPTSTVWSGLLAEAKLHLHALLALLQHLYTNLWQNCLRLLGLVLGGIYAYWFRYFLVEYVGDIAIYVSSYKVSAFQEVRDAIQKTVVDVGKQIVGATLPPTPLDGPTDPAARPLYDGLIFVGHSLGSVIAYDLINALIVWDETACAGRYNVVGRIHRFLTFGSPLDKTAFLFRTQTKQDHHYREALAGLMQPLVLSYDFRPFPWVNLYSRRDPVSGSLVYYDWPVFSDPCPSAGEGSTPSDRRHICNLPDPAARVPILAHVEYWGGDLLTAQLLDALNPPQPLPQRPSQP
jgi:hypothetical protein